MSSYEWDIIISSDFASDKLALPYDNQFVSFIPFPIQTEYMLLTHFPKSNQLNFQVLKPLGKWTWIGFGCILVFISIPFSLYFMQHRFNLMGRRFSNLKMGEMLLYILCIYQHPTNLKWTAGRSKACKALIMLLSVAAIYWHTLYDVEVRSNIIGQTFDYIADSLQDLDVSDFPVYDLDGNSFDETSNKLMQMEMLYVDQKQSCTIYFNKKFSPLANTYERTIKETTYLEVLTAANIIQDVESFVCFTGLIFKGAAVGLISKRSLATYMLMSRKAYEPRKGVYFLGRTKKEENSDFHLRIVQTVDHSNWPLMMMKKYQFWEEEFSLWIHRLYSTGIPDFFLTNHKFIRNNPNIYSIVEYSDDMRDINIFNLKSPFQLFLYAIWACLCAFTLERVTFVFKNMLKSFKLAKVLPKKEQIKLKQVFKRSQFKIKATVMFTFILLFLVTFILADFTSSSFDIDFIIGIGSRETRSSVLSLKLLKGYKEGSVDYFSILAFQRNRHEFLHCLDVIARQVLSRMAQESIYSTALPKSFAFNHKRGIIICGTNLDVECRHRKLCCPEMGTGLV